eukprot:TRINITY_DN9020_c0_g1_i1.p1 TRINITY_DN9020_c0_g1~~TRINITY_DN9020_c0_g1_i1.p1  ORF type:complete len:474 (+),score=75.04 TRINITY_DN9020_c0_g1_i1:94-1422(+)
MERTYGVVQNGNLLARTVKRTRKTATSKTNRSKTRRVDSNPHEDCAGPSNPTELAASFDPTHAGRLLNDIGGNAPCSTDGVLGNIGWPNVGSTPRSGFALVTSLETKRFPCNRAFKKRLPVPPSPLAVLAAKLQRMPRVTPRVDSEMEIDEDGVGLMQFDDKTPGVPDLPLDCVLEIAQHVQGVDLLSMLQVCTLWRQRLTASAEELWKEVCVRLKLGLRLGESWKARFLRHNLLVQLEDMLLGRGHIQMNIPAAIDGILQMSMAGDRMANVLAAMMHHDGIYIPHEPWAALNMMKRCQHPVAQWYITHWTAPVSSDFNFELLESPDMDQSHFLVQHLQAYCHANGYGTARNLYKALHLYAKAALQGYAPAMLSLSDLLLRDYDSELALALHPSRFDVAHVWRNVSSLQGYGHGDARLSEEHVTRLQELKAEAEKMWLRMQH